MQRNILNQSGRSMIEMLGVLAIVGILSIAGITGYSKAMFKYRMNQTVDTVANVFINLYEATSKPIGTTGYSMSDPQDLIDFGIYPECQIVKPGYWSSKGGCKLPLGQLEVSYTLSPSEGYSKGYGYILVYFIGENKKNECIAFLSHHWDTTIPADMFAPRGFIATSGNAATTLIKYSPAIKTSYTESEIVSACNNACVEGRAHCHVQFGFHKTNR